MNTTRKVLIKHDLTKSSDAVAKAKAHMSKQPAKRKSKLIQTVGLAKTDENQAKELEAIQRSPNAETIIEHDSPETRYQMNLAQALLLNKEQLDDTDRSLGLNEARGGWHAQNYEVVSGDSDVLDTLIDAGAQVITDYGEKVSYRSADPEKISYRAQAEGHGNIKGYVASVAKVANIKAEIFGNNPRNDVAKQDRFIRTLNSELEKTSFKDGYSKVLQSALLDQMVRLEDQRLEAHDNHDAKLVDQIRQVQENLEQDYGLELEHKSSFIFARQAKGAALKIPFLGIIVKRPGDIPAHVVDTSGKINTPTPNNNSVVVTARGQIEDRIYTNRVEVLAQALNINTELSLLTGHEIQGMVDGESLETTVIDDPESLNIDEYGQIVKTALTHEALDLEVEDWSAGNFIVDGDSIKLVDLGGSKLIDNPEAIAERFNNIKNISESFHSAGEMKSDLKHMAEGLHDKVLSNKDLLTRLINEVKTTLDSKGIQYDHSFGDRVLAAINA